MSGCNRFISEDPIGWASGQTNNYAYVGGNPISFRDARGLMGGGGNNGANAPTLDCGETQYSLGVNLSIGGSPLGIGAFLGGGTTIGFTSNGNFFLNFQASLSGGFGMIVAVGATGGISRSGSPTAVGMTTATLLQADVAGGVGDMYGVTWQKDINDPRSFSGSTGNLPIISKAGVGLGVQVSAGLAQSVTLAMPALFPTAGCP